MKLNVNEFRRIAGLPLVESEDASPEHEANERALFKKCCDDLEKVEKMCEERLKGKDLTDEHKKQYTDLCECAKRCCADMKKHLESYK
jgi:hypothetical protein